jgi:hypothetical protein
MNQQDDKRFTLTIDFNASDSNANSFYEALAQICEAWNRHKRIQDYSCQIAEFE